VRGTNVLHDGGMGDGACARNDGNGSPSRISYSTSYQANGRRWWMISAAIMPASLDQVLDGMWTVDSSSDGKEASWRRTATAVVAAGLAWHQRQKGAAHGAEGSSRGKKHRARSAPEASAKGCVTMVASLLRAAAHNITSARLFAPRGARASAATPPVSLLRLAAATAASAYRATAHTPLPYLLRARCAGTSWQHIAHGRCAHAV